MFLHHKQVYGKMEKRLLLLLKVTTALAVFSTLLTVHANAAVLVNPVNLNFGVVEAGKESAVMEVTVTNNEATTKRISNNANAISNPNFIWVNDNSDSERCYNNRILSTPAGGDNVCKYKLVFKPSALSLPGQNYSATFTFRVAEGSLQTYSVNLWGTAQAALAEVSKTSLSFSRVVLGQQSSAEVLQVQNRGNAPLSFASLAIQPLGGTEDGTYIIQPDSNSCNKPGLQVAPGANCVLRIGFLPQGSVGQKSASLDIQPTTGTPQHLLVQLDGAAIVDPTGTGTGKQPALTLWLGSPNQDLKSARVRRKKNFTLSYGVNKASVFTVKVFNRKGKVMFTYKKKVVADKGKLTLPTKKLKAGRYRLSVSVSAEAEKLTRSISLRVL